jgi:uncharacterized protein YndB with AHSA1/START domain
VPTGAARTVEVAVPTVIADSTDIARPPREVFDFVSDPARLPRWQPAVIEAAAEPPGPVAVGMRGREVRRVPGGPRTLHWQVTECEPGRRWGVRGVDGPVRAHVTMTFQPTAAGTHLDYRVSFDGHGIGKIIRLLAQRGARAELPANLALLKQQLEASSTVGR